MTPAEKVLEELTLLIEIRMADAAGTVAMYQQDANAPKSEQVYKDHGTLIACSRTTENEMRNTLARIERLKKEHGA